MTREDLKVNWIYYKDTIKDILIYVTVPLWILPALVFAFIITLFFGEDSETIEEDIKWCKENHYVYPIHKTFPHLIVRKLKKEKKRLEKEKKKESIRKWLRNQEAI